MAPINACLVRRISDLLAAGAFPPQSVEESLLRRVRAEGLAPLSPDEQRVWRRVVEPVLAEPAGAEAGDEPTGPFYSSPCALHLDPE